MPVLIRHDLASTGRCLPADTDHLLHTLSSGTMLLIHVPPGVYPFETHEQPEYIICLGGVLRMEDEYGHKQYADTGEMIEVPPGLSHHFSADCDAVLMTLTQNPRGR